MLLYLLITPRKKWCPKKKLEGDMGRPPLASGFQGKPGNSYSPINPKNG
jgi:hypothetical protein